MKKLARLVVNGNSSQVTIPRPMMDHLGWCAGMPIMIALTDRGAIEVRAPRAEDFAPPRLADFASVPKGGAR